MIRARRVRIDSQRHRYDKSTRTYVTDVHRNIIQIGIFQTLGLLSITRNLTGPKKRAWLSELFENAMAS